ncbi:hypothetical protein FPANT_8156 [Fusarium pseudoanthophilum]|uniref:Uncharacterized protein n=1 Tax=Fusarium pseudoanthophilum TaxID=48495 RepID=A0A8H5L3K5_9HYPO|nr:hypothetical protein FPANT_8156 [Fusarium pseudoanthophilum]
MFDRIRRAMICLTTSDDTEIRDKLDEVKYRRAMKEAEIHVRRAIRHEMIIRMEIEHYRMREYNMTAKDLQDQKWKQKQERKKAAKAQASQEKLRLRSEYCPYGMPASRRRPVGGQASIDPGNEIMTEREKEEALLLTLAPIFK